MLLPQEQLLPTLPLPLSSKTAVVLYIVPTPISALIPRLLPPAPKSDPRYYLRLVKRKGSARAPDTGKLVFNITLKRKREDDLSSFNRRSEKHIRLIVSLATRIFYDDSNNYKKLELLQLTALLDKKSIITILRAFQTILTTDDNSTPKERVIATKI